jgi:hypothetical protein
MLTISNLEVRENEVIYYTTTESDVLLSVLESVLPVLDRNERDLVSDLLSKFKSKPVAVVMTVLELSCVRNSDLGRLDRRDLIVEIQFVDDVDHRAEIAV